MSTSATDRRFIDLLLGILMRRYIRTYATSEIQFSDLDSDEYRQMRDFVPEGDFFTFAIGKIVILDVNQGGEAIKCPKHRYEHFLARSDHAKAIR